MGLHSLLSWNYVSWSISVEFYAYIFFFIALISVDKKEGLIMPLVISLASYAILYSLDLHTYDITYDFGFIRCIAAFYLGVFLFRLQKKRNFSLSTRKINLLEFSSILLLILNLSNPDGSFIFIMTTMISFAFVILSFSINEGNGYIGKLIQLKYFRNIGTWSYSIYMVHALIVAMTSNIFEFILKYDLHKGLGVLSIIINICIILITIYISKYTYKYIEDRYRNKTRKFISQNR